MLFLGDKVVIQKLVTEAIQNNPATKCTMDANLVLVACYEKNKVGYYKDFDFNNVGTWGMFDLGMA